MNGIYDLGGLTCFGPVRPEPGEPVFHADWERRVFAMNMAGLAFVGPVDRARHAIERMDPLAYLGTSYYEHWLVALEMMFLELGYVTPAELASGRVETPVTPPYLAPGAAAVEGLVRTGMPATRADGRQQPRFAVGDAVRARNLDVPGHTRLARYVRGRRGVVVLQHGTHAFPDTLAHDRGENPQPLYTVRFDARELWGENVTRKDCVYIDLWEDYLAPEGDA